MQEIGAFISAFGGGGIIIWYFINKDRTTTKEMIETIKAISRVVERQGGSIDDLILEIGTLIDYVMPTHKTKRQTKDIRSRIHERRQEREQNEVLQKINS